MQAQPRILTVERNLRNPELLNKFLTEKGFRTISAANIDELDQMLVETESIALALVDLAGFDKGIWEQCDRLRQSGIPFLVISPQPSPGAPRAGLAHGASGVLVKPLVVKDRRNDPKSDANVIMEKVLALIDHRRNREVLADWLSRSYEVAQSGDDEELAGPFDLALVDGTALERLQDRLRALKKQTAPIFLPVLLMTNRQNGAATTRYLGREVDEVIGTPIDKAELRLRIENLLKMRRLSNELKQQLETVDRLAITDDVSGFHNTRFLHRYLDSLMARSETQDEKVSLVFFDIDGFKGVVDTYGHPLGAKVLKEVAEVVNCYLDLEDRIVRYGGDEYVVILPGQDKAEALKKVERMRQGIATTPFLQGKKINVKVTASFGLATYPHDAKDKRELLAAADRCLFQSKEGGKNRITLSGDTPKSSP